MLWVRNRTVTLFVLKLTEGSPSSRFREDADSLHQSQEDKGRDEFSAFIALHPELPAGRELRRGTLEPLQKGYQRAGELERYGQVFTRHNERSEKLTVVTKSSCDVRVGL